MPWLDWMMELLSVILWRRLPWMELAGNLGKVYLIPLSSYRILTISTGEVLSPSSQPNSPASLKIRRRFQFSSALKRMSSLSTLGSGKILAAVKGAPETVRSMLVDVPEWYDDTYKVASSRLSLKTFLTHSLQSHTRQGKRVLALASKELNGSGGMNTINKFTREQVESSLSFVGFLVFSCPLKEDAIEVLRGLADSSHRVCFPLLLRAQGRAYGLPVRYDYW